MSVSNLKKQKALELNKRLEAISKELFGKELAYVVVLIEEDFLDVATNARPSDLDNLPNILREAAAMIQGSIPAVHNHVDEDN